MTRSTAAAVAAVVLASLLAGCGKDKVAQSGFLNDYSNFRQIEQNTLFYRDAAAQLSRYDKFIIDPIIVLFAPNAEGTAIDPATLYEAVGYFEQILKETLEEHGHEVVTTPGRDTIRIRTAITDIKLTKGEWNILPQTKLLGLGLGGASMEAEAIDTQTGRRVMAIIVTSTGEALDAEGFGSLDDAKQVMRAWVDDLIKRLRAA
jgi:hypothetical protein